MALEGNLCSYHCSLGWDLPSFGALNADMSMDLLSPLASDLCSESGYLEDALGIKWSSCFKRRKTLSYSSPVNDSLLMPQFSKSFWSYDSDNNVGDPFQNSSSQRQKSVIPDDKSSLDCIVRERITNECTPSSKPSTPDGHKEQHSPHSSLQVMTEYSAITKDDLLSRSGETSNIKVVYPFDMVKPGGIEGDVTLNEINKRLLRRPTRPVRHPVGDAACHPRILTDRLGPSGKAVATLTRIHTQGRGSVTIIRTRG
ncbi:hypothetical protein Sjap_014801 [Stephania japonica]|uniref:Protein XRI1 n=1 Tax=Stephania japonica TaxID=461633 RepID=A0AAP0NRU1_9MAGN